MHECALFLFALVVRLVYFFQSGVVHGGDTASYLSFADLITQNGTLFNIPGHPFYYSLYPLLIVFFQKNEIILVAIQILIAATATVTLYRIGKSIFNKKVGVIAALLYSVSLELFQWDTYILTDSLAVSLILLAFYFLIQLLDKRSLFNYGFLSLFLSLLLFLRPASFPFIGLTLFFTVITIKSWPIRYSILTTSFAALFSLFYFFAFHGDKLSLPFFWNYYTHELLSGTIIHHRLYFNLNWDSGFSLHNLTNIFQIFAARAVVYWQVFSDSFSLSHKIINIFYFVPLYFFTILYFIQRKILVSLKERILLSIVIIYWVFNILTEIDYDWRYRITVIPFLILMASSSLEHLLRPNGIYRSLFQKIVDVITFPLRAVTLFENDHIGLSSLRSERFDYVVREIKGKCLDIGCGKQNLFIKKYCGGNGNGIDVYPYEGLTKNELIDDITHFPFQDNSFDTVTLIASINHIPKNMREQELSEAYRCLKPGGTIVVTMGNPLAMIAVHKLTHIYSSLFPFSDMDTERGMHHDENYFLQDYEIRSLLKTAGFSNIKKKYFTTQWFLNHLFIANKR